MKKLIALIATTMVLVFTTAASADLLDGLVGYWPFDGNANDLSGNGNHGSTHGVSLTSDRHGNNDSAYYFDGSSHISVSDSATLRVSTGSITIAAWIKPTKYGVNTVDGSRFVSVLQMGNDYRFQIGMGSNATKAIVYLTSATSAIEISMPSLGSWQFLALTLHSGTLKYYRNGTLVASKYTGDTISTGGGTLTIGLDPGGAPEYHIGDMEDVYIYNRALSSSEIKALYNGNLKVCTISFVANGGEGNMAAQKPLTGTTLALPANTFTREGYIFQGWATSPDGPVVYSDGVEITVDSDKTLYAVWSRPMTLLPESADWSSGSITLRCEDDATSASTPKYSLEYCNESGEWVPIDGAKNIPATKGQNSAGQKVWIAKLTDPAFSSRLGGIPPVSYRVTDETGRVSEPCVTRTKYGIFVSPGGYAPGVDLDVFPSATPNYAETFGRLATGLGAFAKVHVLTGSGAVYSGIDGAFKDIAGKIKCGDVCFLYFGTHGGLQPNSTSSCLVLYDGTDYKENALATHIKLLNGLDASNPDGNGVAIVGFVHACHSKGISDNTGDEYCRVGSWCVNSVLTSKNSAWITATDDPKALSLGDYFSLFLLNYGWGKGWGGNSGEPLSCEQLADYTKKKTDALFDGLIMKGGSVSYSSKVGVFGASAMLRNIMIGKCGNHDSTGIPSDPEEISAQGINTSTIQVQAKSILNADRTLLFKRRGEDAGWEAPCYWQGGAVTFSYDDTDVASSGRELPYYYQIRTLNGAGIGKSTVASAWRIHTESHKVTFMYELPQTVQSPSAGIWWELPYDSTLSEIWNNLEKSVADLGVNGFVHTGWFTEPHGRGSRITRDTRVFKPVTYYAAWTAMTQGWLDSHPATASAANGDIATAATMTAANGCRTVGECYALGINPEDPTDDLRIAQFELQNGKPQLTLNHTADGSGKTFLPDVRVLGTTTLGESPQWDDVTDIANPDAAGYRFFKATVELP